MRKVQEKFRRKFRENSGQGPEEGSGKIAQG